MASFQAQDKNECLALGRGWGSLCCWPDDGGTQLGCSCHLTSKKPSAKSPQASPDNQQKQDRHGEQGCPSGPECGHQVLPTSLGSLSYTCISSPTPVWQRLRACCLASRIRVLESTPPCTIPSISLGNGFQRALLSILFFPPLFQHNSHSLPPPQGNLK